MIETRIEDGVAIVALAHPPANAIGPSLLAATRDALLPRLGDETVRALVITSTHPKIFSAGLDLVELDAAPVDAFRRFTAELAELVGALAFTSKPVIAACTGHAIAGGYLLASIADRVLLAEGNARLGLPEATLGVPMPNGCIDVLALRHTPAQLAEILLLAENVTADRARSLGMVDEVVPGSELIGRATALARQLADHPGHSFAAIKTTLRKDARAAFARARRDGDEAFVAAWLAPAARAARTKLMASLKK